MIYDLRIYTLKPRTVPIALAQFERALPTREKYSRLGAFFTTEVGTLNQIVHIWPYESLAHMEEVRAAAAADPSGDWPLDLSEQLVSMDSTLVEPAPFMEDWRGPRQLGNLYELRTYELVPGTREAVLRAWSSKIDGRRAYSPLAGCWLTMGIGGRAFFMLYHLWAYESFEQRMRIREETAAKGVWPSDDGRNYVRQENKLLVPASFSPMH